MSDGIVSEKHDTMNMWVVTNNKTGKQYFTAIETEVVDIVKSLECENDRDAE